VKAFGRVPIDSPRPVRTFAQARLLLALTALAAGLVFDSDFQGRMVVTLVAAVVPWSVAVYVLALRSPSRALSPFVAIGDLAVLVVFELIVPEAYAATRFAGLFLIAVHAHYLGAGGGAVVGVTGATGLILGSVFHRADDLDGDILVFYECVFFVAAVSSAVLIGQLRTFESTSRVRARALSRRTLQAENQERRRVAEAIHDGPVQELIGLDMVLGAVARAAGKGDAAQAQELVFDARETVMRNVKMLREEIVELGPYAFEELSYETAVDRCSPVWQQRWDMRVVTDLDDLELDSHTAGNLFRITQEAVVNAGRHASPDTVSVSLHRRAGGLELEVADDGRGFGSVDPLGPSEPGHLGLASMRERTELLDGELHILTSDSGTRVLVHVPVS